MEIKPESVKKLAYPALAVVAAAALNACQQHEQPVSEQIAVPECENAAAPQPKASEKKVQRKKKASQERQSILRQRPILPQQRLGGHMTTVESSYTKWLKNQEIRKNNAFNQRLLRP